MSLVLRNVTRAFGGVTAVDDFSLALEEGELVSLLGPSGCGKTSSPSSSARLKSSTAATPPKARETWRSTRLMRRSGAA